MRYEPPWPAANHVRKTYPGYPIYVRLWMKRCVSDLRYRLSLERCAKRALSVASNSERVMSSFPLYMGCIGILISGTSQSSLILTDFRLTGHVAEIGGPTYHLLPATACALARAWRLPNSLFMPPCSPNILIGMWRQTQFNHMQA